MNEQVLIELYTSIGYTLVAINETEGVRIIPELEYEFSEEFQIISKEIDNSLVLFKNWVMCAYKNNNILFIGVGVPIKKEMLGTTRDVDIKILIQSNSTKNIQLHLAYLLFFLDKISSKKNSILRDIYQDSKSIQLLSSIVSLNSFIKDHQIKYEDIKINKTNISIMHDCMGAIVISWMFLVQVARNFHGSWKIFDSVVNGKNCSKLETETTENSTFYASQILIDKSVFLNGSSRNYYNHYEEIEPSESEKKQNNMSFDKDEKYESDQKKLAFKVILAGIFVISFVCSAVFNIAGYYQINRIFNSKKGETLSYFFSDSPVYEFNKELSNAVNPALKNLEKKLAKSEIEITKLQENINNQEQFIEKISLELKNLHKINSDLENNIIKVNSEKVILIEYITELDEKHNDQILYSDISNTPDSTSGSIQPPASIPAPSINSEPQNTDPKVTDDKETLPIGINVDVLDTIESGGGFE